MAVNARTEEFQHIEVFDKPALHAFHGGVEGFQEKPNSAFPE